VAQNSVHWRANLLLGSVHDIEFLYDLSGCSLMPGFWLLDCKDSVVKRDKGKVFLVHATNLCWWSGGLAPLHVNFDSGCR